MHKYRESLLVLSCLEDGNSINFEKICEKTSFSKKQVKHHINFLEKSGLIFDNGLVVKFQVKKVC